MRQNKGSILKASVDYIKLLRRDRERRSGVEERCRKLEQNHRRALLKIQVSHLAAFNHRSLSHLFCQLLFQYAVYLCQYT